MRLQSFAQLRFGAMNQNANIADGCLELGGDLLVAPVAEQMQGDGLRLARRKGGQGGAQLPRGILCLSRLRRVGLPGRDVAEQFVAQRRTSAAAELVDRTADR